MAGEGPAPVVPSQFSPKVNGVAAPPTPEVVKPPPAAPAPSEVETLRAKLAEAEGREVKEKRERITGQRQWEREKQSFGEKLKLADEYARLKREAGVNPGAAAKALWGEKWHEHLNTVQANGGAPTAESVALEIERAEERATAKAQADQQQRDKAAQEAQQRRLDVQLRAFNAEAVEYAKSSAKDYPLFARWKTPERIADMLVGRIRAEHDATVQRDPETNDVIRPGRVMSFKEAADAVEADMVALAEEAAAHEKYQERVRSKLTPPKSPGNHSPVVAAPSSKSESQQSPSSQSSQQGRRSLSNDLTGSTRPDAPENLTDAERMRRALAKYNEALAAKGKA